MLKSYGFRVVLLLMLNLISVFSFAAISQGDPVALLQSIGNNMISGLKANQATLKSKPQIVYNLAYKYVVPYADLGEMSKRVLPPHIWRAASQNERAQFEKAFTTLVIRTYASALSSYKDQAVQFFPVRGGASGKSVEVRGEITSSSRPPIHVTYRLVHNGNAWRLYDLSVEGVSLIDSFRSQFSDILAAGNMAQLLKRLEAHNVASR